MAITTQQRSTVVGVFDDHRSADAAINELRRDGFCADQIGVASRRAEGVATEGATATAEEGSHTGTGAAIGVVAGAGVGGLVGLGIVAGVIPALGPVIAGGTLAAILANAAGGAAIGGVIGALTGAGIPEEEAKYYQSEFEAGRTIVTVKADGRYDEAMAILRCHGAYDMHAAPSRTMGTAWTAAPATARGTTAGVATTPGTATTSTVAHTAETVGKWAVQDTERVAGDVRREDVRVERQRDVEVHSATTRAGSVKE
jgi:hypothetical protein